MQFSGHDQETRYDVYNSAQKAYNQQIEKDQSGERPLHRPKTWMRLTRKKEKLEKKRNWYRKSGHESVLFVPCTTGEALKKAYEEKIAESAFKIKVIERSGKKLSDILHRKNPFKEENCGRNDCFICTSGGRGNCEKENVTYRIKCEEDCKKKDIYNGETSYNGYVRGKEHMHKYQMNDQDSMLIQHCNTVHGGRKVRFIMEITGSFHNDATKRQITEGIDIESTPTNRLMNRQTQWNMPSMPRCVITSLRDRQNNIN